MKLRTKNKIKHFFHRPGKKSKSGEVLKGFGEMNTTIEKTMNMAMGRRKAKSKDKEKDKDK